MRCRIWLCEWDGPAEEWLAHRALEHPTADRVAREHAARLGREPRAGEPSPQRAPGAMRVHTRTPVHSLSPRPVAAEPGSRPQRRSIITRADGYRLVWMPEHPNAHKGYVYEHRLVAERKIGRPLTRSDIVHHINGNRSDNRPENLKVVTKLWHQQHHMAKSGLTDDEIKDLLKIGWTYKKFEAIHVSTQRVRRCRREMGEVKAPWKKCVYCGAPVRRGEVCAGHADLPGLEPLDEFVVAA